MKLRIFSKMLLYILLPAIVGMCLVSFMSYYNAKEFMVSQLTEEMNLVAEDQKGELTNLGLMLRSAVSNGSQGRRVRLFLEATSASAPEEQVQALRTDATAQLAELIHSFPFLAEAGLLDLQGVIVAHTNPANINAQRGDRHYFRQALQGKTGIENTLSRSTHTWATLIAVPVSEGDRVVGVVYSLVDLSSLSKETIDNVRVGSDGLCAVYDGKGILLMHRNKALMGTDASHLPWVREVMQNDHGRVAFEEGGNTKVVYYRSMPEMDWKLILLVDRDDLLSPVSNMLRNNVLMVVCSSLVVGLIIFVVARGLAASLRSCAGVVGYVSEGHLDLDQKQQSALVKAGKRTDEIGVLGRGIGRMVDNIAQLFQRGEQKTAEAEQASAEALTAMNEAHEARQAAESARSEGMFAAAQRLEQVVEVLSLASAQLSAQVEQSGTGASRQAARSEETATAMEQMNSTVAEVARNASSASQTSASARERAQQGALVVREAVESIQQVREEALELKEDMTALEHHANAINEIMGVISDIADQTNLLALNAAIEAARAGEAGRGFAVVADEVRKLAEKTMASTGNVAEAIGAIQKSSRKSISQMDKAVTAIEHSTSLAQGSGTALDAIVTLAEETAAQVRAIATASEEQSAASEQINRSVSEVATIANQTSRTMLEAGEAVNHLVEQAHELARLIEELKKG